MFFLLPSILCKETADAAAKTSTPIGMSLVVLLILDVIFLFYLLLTRSEEVKARQTYIFLVHGTYFFLAMNEIRFNAGIASTLVTIVILAVAYYFICSIPLAVKIIAVLNTSLLFSEMNAIFIHQVFGEKISALLGGSVGLVIAVVLAIFFDDLLLKLHNVFVTYIYTALLVTLLGLVDLVWSGQFGLASALDIISAIVLIGVISVIVFIR
ncbi:hypothetical protein NGRA_3479 [Nosema granulosis]|uniref:Uncharacterized protein n=1 Tax=Nosema granulosis TaxID=83296 RepID=A0A9P6GUN1_9MICR|nr:hypothetical protein NGRA_3479 [Nosema granulosis]